MSALPARPARLEAHRDGALVARFELGEGKESVLGRSGSDWNVPDEPHLSRRHAALRLERGWIYVRRLEGAANPIFSGGVEKSDFRLEPGAHFVIGRTKFSFAGRTAADAPAPVSEKTLQERELYSINAGSRLKLLELLRLPEILRTKNEPEFFHHVAAFLRTETRARCVTIATDGRTVGQDSATDAPAPAPSAKLVERALRESPRPTLYRWGEPDSVGATLTDGIDWALCAAIDLPGDGPLVFYAAGNSAETAAPGVEDAQILGLVADMVGRTLSVRRLEAKASRLKRYFSERVAARILESPDPAGLEPRLAVGTVMFFDIRGFSRRTEGKNAQALEHFGELRRALSAMTEEIFREDGVVLQYTGDGILACWNVPIADPRHADRAARAALAMVERLEREGDGWRCGIGIHTGEVVAGAIGSEQVFYYGLMGAVVNQASRIEGITKALEVPILVGREVAAQVDPSVASCLRVGRFKPSGMDSALDLYELSRGPLSKERSEVFGAGLAAFEAGRWEEAYATLARLPVQDRAARYIMFLAEHYRRHPPANWAGVIELSEK
jgi:adenylate cyclase